MWHNVLMLPTQTDEEVKMEWEDGKLDSSNNDGIFPSAGFSDVPLGLHLSSFWNLKKHPGGILKLSGILSYWSLEHAHPIVLFTE